MIKYTITALLIHPITKAHKQIYWNYETLKGAEFKFNELVKCEDYYEVSISKVIKTKEI